MTDSTKAQILEVARRAVHTEMLALKHMEETLGDSFAAAVELILASRGKCIVTGMGKSGLVGRKIAATLASTGTPSFFLHPGEAFHGDLGMISKEDIVLALSYSGETDEILKIVPFIHSNGNRLISMTGHPDSALAKNSDVHLDVGVREEACILHLAPTSSTTAQIAMGDALAVSLMQQRGFTSVDFARLHPGGSLGRRLLMTVGNVMRDHDLPVVAPDCSAVEMIHTISKGGLGLIVICDGDRIEGIVTDGDVRRAMERLKADFFNIRAIDIATPHPKTIGADEKLIEAERLMTRNKVTSLLVTDAAGKLIGITNAGNSSDENINYAVPLEIVQGVADNIIYYHEKGSDAQCAYKIVLGITVQTQNSKYVYDAGSGYGKIREEVVLDSVASDSIAESMNLQSGDIITAIIVNDTEYEIARSFDISDLILTLREGDVIQCVVQRNAQTVYSEEYNLSKTALVAIE